MTLCLRFTLPLSFLLLKIIFVQSRTFTIDRENGVFKKDGERFQYVAGCFHYFRATRDMWKGILIKMKEGGLNVLETYVEWSSHEPEPGVYNFEGDLDVVSFIKMAHEVGLLVVLRPGPYICAEREFGGFPYWLLREKPNIQLRTMDPVYITYVDKWFDVLLPMMKPLLYQNGGPIILVQVENEYGQYPKCDHEYMTHLRDLNRKHLGNDVILFRTDIPRKEIYNCDKVDGVEVTADIAPGTDIEMVYKTIKDAGTSVFVVTEFYLGWMDHWGEPHAKNDIESIRKSMNAIFALNGSICIYMYYGGTNYGFSNGANAPYVPQPTSYDYAAPISEAGDTTELYYQVRDIISKYFDLPPLTQQRPIPKISIGPVPLQMTTTLLDSCTVRSSFQKTISKYPLTFEALSVAYGFVVYSTTVEFIPGDPCLLKVPGLRDRGYVYLNDQFKGIVSRHEEIYSIPLSAQKQQVITIIVENQGRINYGLEMHDPKGLIENVTFCNQILSQWTMTPVPLTNVKEIQSYPFKPFYEMCSLGSYQPAFFTAKFRLPIFTHPGTVTFLDPTGWQRGVAFLNGVNLGRYWPVVGPQVTLFVPGSVLKPYPEENVLTLLELEKAPSSSSHPNGCSIKFLDKPIIDGPTPTFSERNEFLDFTKLYDFKIPDGFFEN